MQLSNKFKKISVCFFYILLHLSHTTFDKQQQSFSVYCCRLQKNFEIHTKTITFQGCKV